MLALKDFSRKIHSSTIINADTDIMSNENNEDIINSCPVAIIAVVGAGRGPLVAAALGASLQSGISVRIYAIEKNPNAVITLRNRLITERWTNVTIVHSDMRGWDALEPVDIMISELLGSWGDNELSPECLDGAQKCLKRDTGVSIPVDYTSFMAPISCSKLWMTARDLNPTPQSGQITSQHAEMPSHTSALDSPYVVKFHHFYQLATSLPLFTFEHPNPLPLSAIDNSRYIFIYQEIY